MKGFSKKILVVLCMVAIVSTFAIVLAVGIGIRSPDSVPLTVDPTPSPSPSPSPTPTATPVPTLSQVVFPVSPITVGATTTLSTTLSNGVAGITVEFYDQHGNFIGATATDTTGTATIQITPPVGTWVYHANA